MKFRYFFNVLMVLHMTNVMCGFQLPTDDRAYNETTFLAAHNAYSAYHYGYAYAQQLWDLDEQLTYGVRCFLLDTYSYEGLTQSALNKIGKVGEVGTKLLGKKEPSVRLCHGSCDLTATLLRPGKFDTMKLKTVLKSINAFLKKNPHEIVTIILENDVKDGKLLDDAFEIVKSYILKPSDFNPQGATKWPTLKWMKDTNKRLVIFADHVFDRSNYIYDQWPVMAENEFSSINFDKVCQERGQSARYRYSRRNLLLFNFFPAAPIPVSKEQYTSVQKAIEEFKKINFTTLNSRGIRNALTTCLKSGAYPDRYPNFIALDFVNKGNPIAFINEINAMGNDPAKRATMYKPLQIKKN